MEAGLEVHGWRPSPATSWHDVGTPERYLGMHEAALRGSWVVCDTGGVHHSAKLEEWGLVGHGCRIGAGARLSRCVLWDGAVVAPGEVLDHLVIAPWARAGAP